MRDCVIMLNRKGRDPGQDNGERERMLIGDEGVCVGRSSSVSGSPIVPCSDNAVSRYHKQGFR